MQRIHNWKELHLCNPPGERRYIHIDSVFSTQVERELIETIGTETAPKSARKLVKHVRQNSAQRRGAHATAIKLHVAIRRLTAFPVRTMHRPISSSVPF